MNTTTKKAWFGCVIGLLLAASQSASAEVIWMGTDNAKGWILENYNAGPVVIWNSGAQCATPGAALSLVNTNTAEVNRLWSVVASAKAAGTPIFIRYRNENCTIESFGFR